ncbi:MAG: tetratricopeptide repeat protein [Thaumarchaeota archaeon]|nr:tetratricopeptide repeat protein [Nitrososphaerota archaeon]MDE1842244.1 tetratricopeptide repeat protein [Nitrososphaerota archaeon]
MKKEIASIVLRISQLVEDGDFDQALIDIEKALVANPNNPDLLNKKGVVLRALGRYDEALECFNKSLQIDPRDLRAS